MFKYNGNVPKDSRNIEKIITTTSNTTKVWVYVPRILIQHIIEILIHPCLLHFSKSQICDNSLTV